MPNSGWRADPVSGRRAKRGGRGAGLRRRAVGPLHHGRRRPPSRPIETGQLAFRERSSIYLDGKNVLSIIVEFDPAPFLGGESPIAVVGETLTRGKLAVRIERTGRPEVKNMLLGS